MQLCMNHTLNTLTILRFMLLPLTLNLPSVRIDRTKLEHLNADKKDALLKLLDEFADVFFEKPGLCCYP